MEMGKITAKRDLCSSHPSTSPLPNHPNPLPICRLFPERPRYQAEITLETGFSRSGWYQNPFHCSVETSFCKLGGMNVLQFLQQQFAVALKPVTAEAERFSTMVRPSQDAKFGDYQANCAMPLKKELGGNPRDIAQKIIDGLPDQSLFASIEIAGPGFINLKLADDFLIRTAAEHFADADLGVPKPGRERKPMVIDYSSPNVAKPMHVGHLRSTVIGDAIARLYRALGWTVIADNHLGDWGTQFGMLIYGWRHLRDEAKAKENPLQELARLYKAVNKAAEEDPEIARLARLETAKLHEGDPENLALWNEFMPWCLGDLARLYDRLDIRFDKQLGESFFQPMLAKTVDALNEKGIASESDGAVCIFFPDPTGKVDDEGKPVYRMAPTIIKKTDGAFTYATSDLACLQYRLETFEPDLIVYVVDDRQSLHFEQIFEIFTRWHGETNVRLVHVPFGKIMGKDGKPYKTREGGTVGLEPLLDEAVTRARKIVDENSGELEESERAAIADVVGMGAVKYADLCQNRASDYIFDWDKMISLNGNTAAYLQYAYARNRSIFRRGEIDPSTIGDRVADVQITEPSERGLILELLRFSEAIQQAADDFKPNILCNYLYELSNAYSDFFRDCPVLKAPSEELKNSRLVLCELTARTLKTGLKLLGIETPERM